LDHGVFLQSNARYVEAMKNRHDPRLFIRLVHEAGYATDPAYADKIIRLMDRYNLYVYDDI
jgi:flagellar protein FlgJ